MNLFDTTSKRWLAVLAVACVASMAVLAHAFMTALAPDNTPVVQAPAADVAVTATASMRNEPAWTDTSRTADPVVEIPQRVSPFGDPEAAPKKDAATIQKEKAHEQAVYLRQLIAAGKLPKSLGHLTKEQVDEMEKNGETIE